MTTKVNIIENVVVGEYGDPIFLALVDELNEPVDVSSYDTITVLLRSPDSLRTVTITAELFSDGTDGKIVFYPGQTDIDRAGKWTGMVKLVNTGTSIAKSKAITMEVSSTL
jgi:hypothetical protein